MTSRELTARAGLQIALESNRPLLVRELNDDMKSPRSVPRRVRASAGVVIFQSTWHVGRQTDVEARAVVRVLEHIDYVFVTRHTANP